MPDARGNDAVPTTGGTSTDDTALLDVFTSWLEVPKDIKTVLDAAQDLRRWMSDVLMKDDTDTVVTHHVLRYQQADLAHLTATAPKAAFQPRRKFYAPPAPTAMPGGQAAPPLVPTQLVQFGKTMELLANFFAERGRLRDAANIAARDAKTVRAGWLKLVWRSDPDRTPLGQEINDPETQNLVRFRELRRQFADGLFTADSAKHSQLVDLEAHIRANLIDAYNKILASMPDAGETVAQVSGPAGIEIVRSTHPLKVRVLELIGGATVKDDELTNVPRYYGFDFDVIDIEDIRLDWTIVRPEHYARTTRMAHRVSMRRDDILARFSLTDEQRKAIYGLGSDEPDHERMDTTDQKHEPSQVTQRAGVNDIGEIDVWEVWDIDTRMVYIMIPGVDFFLNKYEPVNTGPQWFPFFYLWFNEMSGHFYAPSDVELQMPLQDELNEIRSHAREYRKATLPRLMIGKGAMSPEEIAKFEQSHPFQVIEVEKPDDIQKTLQRFEGIDYNPALVSVAEAMMEMQLMAGMPAAGLGGVKTAELATEVAFAKEQLYTQLDRKKYAFNTFLGRIFTEMATIIYRSLPYENAVAIAGPGCVFPQTLEEREALFVELALEVKTSPTGKPNVKEELEHLNMVSQIMQAHGMQMNPLFMAARLSEILGVNTDFQSLVAAIAPPAPPAGGRAAGGDKPPAPGGPVPGPSAGMPGKGMQAAPIPQQLPGGMTPR